MNRVELNNQLAYMSSKSDIIQESLVELIDILAEIDKEFTYDELDEGQKEDLQTTLYNLILAKNTIQVFVGKEEE